MNDFVAPSGIDWSGDVGVVKYGPGDSGMVVMFYLHPVLNPARSNELGSSQYDDVVFVRIHPPGERLNIIDRKATDNDKRRFPIQWQQFMQNRPQTNNGVPIDLLFPAQPSISAALKASGVHTIEQCSELSAHAIETIGMGCQNWVNDAKRYLEVANKGVKASQLKAAMEERDRENASLKNKIELLEAELVHLREVTSNAVTMKDVQQLMAQNGGNGNRATFAPGKLDKAFDAQTAQINGTHSTRDLVKAKAKKPEPPKRARARIA